MDFFGPALWSNAEVAELFGVSPQRLGILCKQGILPLPTNGLHDPKIVVAAYVRHLKSRQEGPSQAGESMRKVQLENELRTIKLQRMAGELVPVARVQKEWFESTRRVRDGLLNLPSRLSGIFAAETTQEKIFEIFTQEIYAVLSGLSRGAPDMPVESDLPVQESPDEEAGTSDGSATSPPEDASAEPTTDAASTREVKRLSIGD